MASETIPMICTGLEETLVRVLLLVNDEMMELSSNIQDIKFLTYGVISLLEDAVMKERIEAVRLWLIKLEEVAYEAEDVFDEVSYEIGHRKVHNNPLGHIRFLKNVVFDFELAQKVKNVNRVLRMIEHEGKAHLRPSETSNLAFRFRLCLGFCLSFPKDFLIRKTELIQLWMAAGLLQSFDEGNYCFETFSSSTLPAVQKDEEMNDVVYKTGGLYHESSREYNNTSCICFRYATTSMSIPKDRANKLRALILDGVPFQESWKLERLRILVCLNSVDMEMLPSSIGRLKHLRYLDVSNTRIRALPEFITKLYNLQTLRFLQCKELNELPTQFNNLINLKNIAFSFEHQMPFGLGLLTCLETLSFFVVGSNRGHGIKELRYLNGLRGHLKIIKLEEVRDSKEAERADLQQKVKINELSFQWSYGAHDRSSSDEKLLEGLQPHTLIQTMKIKYYMGENWPSWMLRTGYSSVINNLVSLTLERFWNCIQLPCLGDLPHLEFLTIQHMERVKYICNELYKEIDSKGNTPRFLFPALKSLSLNWMENLTKWSSTEKPLDPKNVVVFPHLETLSIQSCAKLTSFPIEDLSALVIIEIKDCDELRFFFHEQRSFPSLRNLSIEGCPKLTDLPDQLLSDKHFNRLKVRRCEWLIFISNNLRLQSSLFSLEISCCKGLTFFSEEILCKLTQLRKLGIGAFSEKLDDFRYLNRIKDLPFLQELEIWGSDFFGRKMTHLPDQLQHLTSLESLKIMGFTAMEALPEWLSDFQPLQCLSLNYCWNLKYQTTATIIQRLSNIKHLNIYGCHTLEEYKTQWNEFSPIKKIKIQFTQLAE